MNKVFSGALMCAFLWLGSLAVTGCYLVIPPVVISTSSSTFSPAPISSRIFSSILSPMIQLRTVTQGITQAPVAGALTRTPIAQPTTATPVAPPMQPDTPVGSERLRAPLDSTAEAVPVDADTADAALPTAEPVPVGTVVFYEEDVTLLTYPLARYQSDALDPLYNWPYKRFDMDRFRLEAPTPAPHTYRLLVLENAYLKISILPELGGRIWQVIHKPSGTPMFYQNDVVKPTHWGVDYQKGWLALGGLEWSLPVSEHGYDWGTPWGYIPLSYSADRAAVTVFTPQDGRLLNASITISLRAGAASFEIEPTLTNLADQPLAFSFWHDAMLAPGSGKQPSAQLHFVLPGKTMTLHSTNDATLPRPGREFPWPTYGRRDLSRLGNFRQYLGFFEAPAAHGPFVGLYDPTYDAGAVRVFPAAIARGSKVFALGWQDALESSNFADDDSMYVELHGGLAPTFDDQYQLSAHGEVNWRETWYPVAGMGDLTFANADAAISVQPHNQQLAIGLYTTRPMTGELVSFVGDLVYERLAVAVGPDAPYQGMLAQGQAVARVTRIELQDRAGRVLLTYQLQN